MPDALRDAAAAELARSIQEDGGRMGTGFLGTKPLLPLLTATGHHDLAVRLLQSRQFPSWGYEVVNGATTIWERWNSYTRENGFGDASMNSFSHYAFGAVAGWMFRSLAGIDTDGPGYARILIQPGPPSPGSNPDNEPISWVRAEYDSIRGKIASNWRRDGDRFEFDVTIPANATATVRLPATDAAGITEGGEALDAVEGVSFDRMEDGHAILEVGSGEYRFASGL